MTRVTFLPFQVNKSWKWFYKYHFKAQKLHSVTFNKRIRTHWFLLRVAPTKNIFLIVTNLTKSMTNAPSMQYTITGKQCDEWASVLNPLGLVELHKAGQISSRTCVCVCVSRVKRLLILVVEKSDSIKTSPEADTKHLASMELLCPWPSEPHSGCRGMCISFVPCESQIHLRCTSPGSLPPTPTSYPTDKVPFPSLTVGLGMWNTAAVYQNCHFIRPQQWRVIICKHFPRAELKYRWETRRAIQL